MDVIKKLKRQTPKLHSSCVRAKAIVEAPAPQAQSDLPKTDPLGFLSKEKTS